MSKGEMKKCNICKKIVKCDETDKESKDLFKKDFPMDNYKYSKYVCWDCYNKGVNIRNTNKSKPNTK